MFVNGALGFAILIATLFGMGNVDDAINTPTGFAFIEIFTQATCSVACGTALTSIIIFMILAAAIGATATSSRMIWAFARDHGLPFSGFLSKVPTYVLSVSTSPTPRTNLPASMFLNKDYRNI